MVIDLQKKLGLVQDGIVGRNTANAIKNNYKLTREGAAHFLAQLHHESSNYKAKRENLNYSWRRLIQVFSYYRRRPLLARKHHRSPMLIANTVYNDKNRSRSGKLGNTQKGDGWKFRGNGALQLTGRSNHQLFSDYVGDKSIMENTDVVWKDYYLESALWFFLSNNLWKYTKNVNYETCKVLTKRINGGYNGLSHRYELTKYYYKLLK